MKRNIFLGALAVVLLAGVALAQSVVNYNEQGGARTVIGGSLDVVSGGDLDIESGGALKIAGTAMSSTAAELDQAHLTLLVENVSGASTSYVVAPASGNITAVYSVLFGDITTADATLTVSANGTAVSPATLTLTAVAGDEAGTIDSLAPTEDYAVTAGQVITVATDGGSTNDVDALITIIIDR